MTDVFSRKDFFWGFGRLLKDTLCVHIYSHYTGDGFYDVYEIFFFTAPVSPLLKTCAAIMSSLTSILFC